MTKRRELSQKTSEDEEIDREGPPANIEALSKCSARLCARQAEEFRGGGSFEHLDPSRVIAQNSPHTCSKLAYSLRTLLEMLWEILLCCIQFCCRSLAVLPSSLRVLLLPLEDSGAVAPLLMAEPFNNFRKEIGWFMECMSSESCHYCSVDTS